MPVPVLEKRSHPRVNLAASGLLLYREEAFYARLENISLAGALVSFREGDCPSAAPGERCSLELYRTSRGEALRFTTRLVHLGFGMACVRFVDLEDNTRLMLRSMIAHQIPEQRPAPVQSSLGHG